MEPKTKKRRKRSQPPALLPPPKSMARVHRSTSSGLDGGGGKTAARPRLDTAATPSRGATRPTGASTSCHVDSAIAELASLRSSRHSRSGDRIQSSPSSSSPIVPDDVGTPRRSTVLRSVRPAGRPPNTEDISDCAPVRPECAAREIAGDKKTLSRIPKETVFETVPPSVSFDDAFNLRRSTHPVASGKPPPFFAPRANVASASASVASGPQSSGASHTPFKKRHRVGADGARRPMQQANPRVQLRARPRRRGLPLRLLAPLRGMDGDRGMDEPGL